MRISSLFFCTILIGSIFLSFGYTKAYACSCMEQTTKEHLDSSQAVFTGKVLRIDEFHPSFPLISSSDPLTITFQTDTVWKGQPEKIIKVNTALESASCGYPFELSKKYLVYAYSSDQVLTTGLCSGTKPFDLAAADFRQLGAGIKVTETGTDSLQYVSANIGEEFEIRSNHSAIIESENILISFLEVTEDSRCPVDATCVWQGQATVRLIWNQNGYEKDLLLIADQKNNDVLDDYLIYSSLRPNTVSNQTIAPQQYVLTLLIDKKDTESVILAPLKQIKLGVEPHCKPGLLLVERYDGSPACVKPLTKEKLIQRGWIHNK